MRAGLGEQGPHVPSSHLTAQSGARNRQYCCAGFTDEAGHYRHCMHEAWAMDVIQKNGLKDAHWPQHGRKSQNDGHHLPTVTNDRCAQGQAAMGAN